MCYSAQVVADWKRFVHQTGARMSIRDFFQLMKRRLDDSTEFRLPRGFDLEFANPKTDEERAIKDLVDQFRKAQIQETEAKIFAQRKRVADAERKLAVKQTKAAAESMRIATTKVQLAMRKLALLTDDNPTTIGSFPRITRQSSLCAAARKSWCRPATCCANQALLPLWMTD